MLRAARGHAVGELGGRAALQVDVLDLDIAGRPVLRFEQEVHARARPVGDFAADRVVAGQWRDRAGLDRLGGESVRPPGVDAHQALADSHHLPAEGELPLGVRGGREPGLQPLVDKPRHRAGIGDMGGDGAAVLEAVIAQEALVALDAASPGGGGGGKRMGISYAPQRPRLKRRDLIGPWPPRARRSMLCAAPRHPRAPASI